MVPALFLLLTAGVTLYAQQRQYPQDAAHRIAPEGEKTLDQSRSQSPPPGTHLANADYVIGPEDVLKIDVFQVPELSNLLVRVSNEGTIDVPLLGDVEASGMTATQLAQDLQAKWGKNYLYNPEVTVFVQEFHAKPVSIVGEVEKPGLYYLTGPRSLIDMISLAGGLSQSYNNVAGPTVYVTRQGGFRNVPMVPGMTSVASDKVKINIHKLLYSKESALNIPIKPLDIISVSKADVVYVTGRGVQKPGGFILQDRDTVTVFQALAMAEGLGPNAAAHDARIIRQTPGGSRVVIPVDLDKLQKGKAPDPDLAANDILFVPDSTQKKALKRALESTISTVSGLLIFGRI